MSSRVTLQSVLTAVSSKPVGSGKTQRLSPLDHAMGLHSLHLIFYCNHNLIRSFELDPMRDSLTEVLSHYPMITGRLVQGSHGNWEIKYNDAGVRVTRATVDTTLDEWLTSANGSEERHLTAWDDMPDDPHTWSPFRIQVNEFQGGGVAIGLSFTHLLADVTCAISFFRSWTEAYRHLPITHPPFSTPISPPPTHTPSNSPPYFATKSSTKPLAPSPKMATATFKFSTSAIQQCLSQVNPICPNATPFDILSALFWTRVSRLKRPKNHHTRHSLSICIDFRSLLKPPLPTRYFGNALYFSLLSSKVGDLESSRLGYIAGLVHSHVEGIKKEEIWSTIGWLESQKEVEGGKFRAPTCMYGPELTCVCMEKSLPYAAMFHEKERVAHVSCHVGNVEGEGLIMVMPSSEGGLARTVMVMLPGEELAVLCHDEAILQLHPAMLLSGTPLSH